MNILVVSSCGLYSNFSSSFVHNQAKAYALLGHRVRAVVMFPYPKSSMEGHCCLGSKLFEQDGVEVLLLRCISLSNFGTKGNDPLNSRLSNWAVRLQMRSILKDFVPDVVHGHGFAIGGIAGRTIASLCHVPLVITTHGGDLLTPIQNHCTDLIKRVGNQADAVVAVSSMLQKKAIDCGIVRPVYTILNGFLVRSIHDTKKISHRIVQVGNLTVQKRVHNTLRAIAKLSGKYPDLSLVLVGDGEYRRELESLTDSLNIRDRVTFTGLIPNDRAQRCMAEAEIFVMPSKAEGFGIVYLEAMANGCLTIGSTDGGIVDVIRNGENGILVEPDQVDELVDQIDWCFQNPQKTAVMMLAGQHDVVNLNWNYNAEQYLKLFKEVTNYKKSSF